jgi:hypothetical protein
MARWSQRKPKAKPEPKRKSVSIRIDGDVPENFHLDGVYSTERTLFDAPNSSGRSLSAQDVVHRPGDGSTGGTYIRHLRMGRNAPPPPAKPTSEPRENRRPKGKSSISVPDLPWKRDERA